tara:strand:+ start:876 stop:1358 length:483 start_codon:yes stop_codon:yes gene_type:complete
MKNIAWHMIESGEIVSFRYKSESGRSVQRVVLCLDPEFRYRKKSTGRVVQYFIGLEIYASDKGRLPKSRITELFEILGKVDNDTPTQTPEQDIEQTYLKLKGYLKRNSIFKTYFLRKCRKNRVFLENKYQSLNSLQVKGVSEKISKEKKTLNILEQNLED